MGVHQASLVLPLSSWDVSQGERTVDTWTRLSLSTPFSLPENSLTRRPRNRKCDRSQTLDTTQTQNTDIEKQTGQVASLPLGSWSSGWSRRSRTSPQNERPPKGDSHSSLGRPRTRKDSKTEVDISHRKFIGKRDRKELTPACWGRDSYS